MSLSITPLYSIASAADLPLPSAPASSGDASGSASADAGSRGASTSTPASTASTTAAAAQSSSSVNEPPRPPLSQQIQDLYNQGVSINEIAVQLYTTVSIVNSDLDIATTTALLSGSVQLTA
ncbi:hypothetical protein [Silvibacterium sp.]|uniref:hypothetical protein n=1 Tax=Silvibacterium sp. TaxID=1964179 RepID=UPI0039E418C3